MAKLSKYVCDLKRKKIILGGLKRAQPVADGNSLVCRLWLKESMDTVEKKRLLKKEE